MRVLFLLVLLLFPGFACAAEEDFSPLTGLEGRYTVGPWEGSMQGKTCILGNSEPLAFADLELSARQGEGPIALRLMSAQPEAAQGLTLQLDDAAASSLAVKAVQGALTTSLEAAQLKAFASAKKLTLNGHVFSLLGFDRAFTLFTQCRSGALPQDLPYEPLAESDPQAIAGAKGWELITLRVGEKVYARYAMLAKSNLGLWRYANQAVVLSLAGMKGAAPYELSLNGTKLPYVPGPDGLMVPLSQDVLHQLESAKELAVRVENKSVSFPDVALQRVVAALQFAE